ncbi:Bro-N domain-containing protein [Vibrio amylolyticus]|uniref:BRO-N domain-containing protein n=1 Tax=Vibrio amylolyticus TaxID=2847292 RepID=UPI003553627A
MTSALTFQNIHFDVVEQNNQLWLTASEIAKALGYVNTNSISRIYARNKEEFANGMTEEVKLTLSGNLNKSVRIFSLRGAHLIAMFSRTAIAKQFRKWVLDVLDKETKSTVVDSLPITSHCITTTSPWPKHYHSNWNRSTFPLFGTFAHYLSFSIQPKGHKYCATFLFADRNQQTIYQAKQLGDLGYFEARDTEELWEQVIKFCARCHSKSAFFE